MIDEKIALAFSNLRSGWCDVDILLGGDIQFGGTFSYTPNDGLADFIRCVAAIASPYPHAEAFCLWSREPGAFRITLQNQYPHLILSIYSIKKYDTPIYENRNDMVFTCRYKLYDFCKATVLAFQTLATVYGIAGYEEKWHHAYPKNDLENLVEKLKDIKLVSRIPHDDADSGIANGVA